MGWPNNVETSAASESFEPCAPPGTGDPLDRYFAARRAEIDAALERALPRPPHCPRRVAEAMRYGVTSGGKRIRPLLTLAAAETVARANHGGSADAVDEARRLAMPAACAIEFIHSYSLIHDDLPAMDNDSLRRGRPTVHIVYGEALAILAGDGLLAEAFALLANEPIDTGLPQISERKLSVLKRLGGALGAGGMLGGQAMDLEVPDARDPLALREMHARKTGSLFRAAAVAGAIMGGGTAAQINGVDRFAAEVGVAFQIVDDILDEVGTPHVLGKTPGKDRRYGKTTYPTLFGLDRSRALAVDCADRAEQALRASGLVDDRLVRIAHGVISRCR